MMRASNRTVFLAELSCFAGSIEIDAGIFSPCVAAASKKLRMSSNVLSFRMTMCFAKLAAKARKQRFA